MHYLLASKWFLSLKELKGTSWQKWYSSNIPQTVTKTQCSFSEILSWCHMFEKKRKKKHEIIIKKILKHKKNDSLYDIFPKGFSKDKLIWVPGQTQALLLGRRSWDLWTDFDQQEGLFGRDGGREVCLPGSLWIDEQLNGLMR